MKYTWLLIPFLLLACQKKRENPPQLASPANQGQPPTQPPTSSCLGAATPWSLPAGELVNDNSSRDFTIPGFDTGCGDTVRVYMRRPNMFPADPWTEYFTIDNGASYYSLAGNVVTMHNRTGIILEVGIEAVLN